MRVIFAGTPEFGVPVLEALARQHEIVAVLTQPDRPRGRSQHPSPTPVNVAAEKLNLRTLTPADLCDESLLEDLRSLDARAMVVVAYGRILPKEVLDLTPAGCINVHPSLLPRYRGAAPIQRAIMNGDQTSGVSIMKLDEGMDTGPIYAQAEMSIGENETGGELAIKLGHKATRLLLGVLDEIDRGTAAPHPQSDEVVSIAEKIAKDEALIDWTAPAGRIHDLVRALNPVPVAHTVWDGRRLKVWRTALTDGGELGPPGVIVQIDPHLKVGTGAGDILLLEVQPESKGKMSAPDFVRGHRPSVGDKLGEP